MNKFQEGVLTGAALAAGGRGSETHRHYHSTTTHVHRAPTDESVRLLKEMEEAAREKLMGSGVIETNTLKAKFYTWRDIGKFNAHIEVRYTLNGCEERKLKFDIPDQRAFMDEVQWNVACFDTIHKAIIEDLARLITLEAFIGNAKVFGKRCDPQIMRHL